MNFHFLIRKFLFRALFGFDTLLGNKPSLFVLCYHSIANDWQYSVSVSEFKKQIEYLDTYYNFVSPKEFADICKGKKVLNYPSVLITFDDGYADILKIKDFLKTKKIRPLLFLLSNPEKVNRKELANTKTLLTKKQVLSLRELGWEIGNHGATHCDFWTLNKKGLDYEISKSKKLLAQNFGKINFFAYPKGRYSQQVLAEVSKAGYSLAFSMNDGFISERTNKLQIPRVGINKSHSLEEFKALFSPSVIVFRKICKTFRLERAFV